VSLMGEGEDELVVNLTTPVQVSQCGEAQACSMAVDQVYIY
jgi:hypothetical protein